VAVTRQLKGFFGHMCSGEAVPDVTDISELELSA
jgi:hypothetical protein